MASESKPPTCPDGHPMERKGVASMSWMTQVLCDSCKGVATEDSDYYWTSSKGNYDLCAVCPLKPVCREGHPLVRSSKGMGSWFTGMQCDGCQKNPWSVAKSVWSCRKCDFDLCRTCTVSPLPPAKKDAEANASAPKTVAAAKAVPAKAVPAKAVPAKAVPMKQAPPPVAPPTVEQVPSVQEQPESAENGTCAESKEPEVPLSEAALMQKERDEAMERKRAIEERIARDAEALRQEEERLDSIRKKINDSDKIRLRSEELRSKIEQAKRDMQRLDQELVRKKDARKRADEYAKQAAEAQTSCEGQLAAKKEECQQLEEDMVKFLLEEASSTEEKQETENSLPKDTKETAES